jgi:DNA primase
MALISDQIGRSVYVEKVSKELNIAPQVLHTEINKILRQKNRKRSYQREDDYEVPGLSPQVVRAQSLPEKDGPEAQLIKEKEIMRVLLVHGNAEMKLELDTDDEEGEEIMLPVAEYMLHELSLDGINFTSDAFSQVIQIFRDKYTALGSFPEVADFVRDHVLSSAVAELVAEPHSLSENWEAKHRIFTESEAEHLKRTACDPLIRIKLQQVLNLIKDLDGRLKESAAEKDGNEEELTLLIQEKMRLNSLKSQLSDYFGTVIL